MEERVEELYFSIESSLQDVVEDKIDVFSKFQILLCYINNTFSDNRYYEDLVAEINNNFKSYFDSLEFEHTVYQKIYDYLDSIEDFNIVNPFIFVFLSNIYDICSEEFMKRTLCYSQFLTYYNMLISGGVIDKNNIRYPLFESNFSDEVKSKILAFDPEA